MLMQPGGRSNSNVDMKKANQDDEILNQYIGVLAKLCESDHFIDNNMNTIRGPLEMVEDDHKIEICNRLNGDLWVCIYDYIRKMSFANNVQKITRMQNVLRITNIIEFIGNAYPYSILQLMKVKVNSGKIGAKKRMKQLEYDEGEIIVSYILKLFYTATSIDINDIFTILDKEMYIDALFKLYQSLLLCMKN